VKVPFRTGVELTTANDRTYLIRDRRTENAFEGTFGGRTRTVGPTQGNTDPCRTTIIGDRGFVFDNLVHPWNAAVMSQEVV